MTRTEARSDPRILAIRRDKLVGHGSCTSIDECYDAIDLVDALDEAQITDAQGAVEWARDLEGVSLEKGLNQRWGEDDDPQLQAWQAWQKAN